VLPGQPYSFIGPTIGRVRYWALKRKGATSAGDPMWAKGEDVCGDPPQEEQGLNSVFGKDATVGLVKRYAKRMQAASGKYLEKGQSGGALIGK